MSALSSASSMYSQCVKSFSIGEVKSALRRNDFDSVIHNRIHFVALFFLKFYEKSFYNRFLSYQLEDNRLLVTGTETTISYVEETIEGIRQFFKCKWSSKKFDIIILENHFYGSVFKAHEQVAVKVMFSINEFNLFFPCMKSVIKSLGRKCVRSFGEICECSRPLIIIEKVDDPHVYQIEPKAILTLQDRVLESYSMYQSGILCDLTLKASDGELKVHSTHLYLTGGDVIKSMLVSGMKESTEKTISFAGVTLSTLKVFMDFTYFGEKALVSEDRDLLGLFEFAHTYQITSLIDGCINAFSLFCTVDDIETIQQLVERFGNKDLEELLVKLSKPRASQLVFITEV